MENYKALSNLPFGIKKGDILTLINGVLYNIKDEKVPYDYKDKKFFELHEVLSEWVKKGDLFIFDKDVRVLLNINDKIISKYDFAKIASNKKNYFVVDGIHIVKNKKYISFVFENVLYKVFENHIIPVSVYYFIDSKGTVHSDIAGKDISADKFRKISGNFFDTKEDANAKLASYYI